jgi:hypothetical protein
LAKKVRRSSKKQQKSTLLCLNKNKQLFFIFSNFNTYLRFRVNNTICICQIINLHFKILNKKYTLYASTLTVAASLEDAVLYMIFTTTMLLIPIMLLAKDGFVI